MSRSLLHKNKLEDFKLWLSEKGIEHRPGKGNWQVLQVAFIKPDGVKVWNAIYERIDMKEHLTSVRYLDSTIAKFCRENKKHEH